MLTKCPECQLPVSDKAISCPHCGYPLKSPSQSPTREPRTTRHKRLPNGFGQITKISNRNLRCPYRAMVPAGKTDEGRPISKMLKPKAYFRTYNEAYEALVEYNKDPYAYDTTVTVEEVYSKWKEEFLKKPKAKNTIYNYESPWKYCSSVYKLPIRQLKVQNIKSCIEAPEVPTTIRRNIKMLFNVLLDYAMEYEYVDKNYSRMFKLPEEISLAEQKQKKPHASFTDEEMKLLWSHSNSEDVQSVLIQCYTGLRPQELCLIYLKDIRLDDQTPYFIAGMKTKAGVQRKIPIHPAIKEFIQTKYQTAIDCNSDRLITACFYQNKNKRIPIPYSTYSYRFELVMEQCGIANTHRPHDPRKQFVTMAKKYKLDEFAIKRIVGHTINDVTEAFYTDRNIDWLYEEICKIPCRNNV